MRDRLDGVTERVSVGSDGAQSSQHGEVSAISDDGRYVSFEAPVLTLIGVHAAEPAAYVRDRVDHTTRLLSVQEGGAFEFERGRGHIAFSGNGEVIAHGNGAQLVAGDSRLSYDVFVSAPPGS